MVASIAQTGLPPSATSRAQGAARVLVCARSARARLRQVRTTSRVALGARSPLQPLAGMWYLARLGSTAVRRTGEPVRDGAAHPGTIEEDALVYRIEVHAVSAED
jgi:hypothetical protein